MIYVNGEALDLNLVEEAFNRIKAAAEARLKVSCCERDPEFRAEAQEEVIDSLLIAQDAEESTRDEVTEDAVLQRLEEVIKEYREHGASWEMLERQRDAMVEEISADMRMRHYIQKMVDQLPPLDDEALKKVYAEKQQEFATLPRAKCLHICLFPHKYDDLDALLKRSIEVRDRALSGEDFHKLALECTEKEDKDVDLGWIDLEDAMHPFEAMLFTMRAGEIAPVLSYDQAYHIIKVTETDAAAVPPFEEVRERVEEIARIFQRKEALEARAKELRKSAKIERLEEAKA